MVREKNKISNNDDKKETHRILSYNIQVLLGYFVLYRALMCLDHSSLITDKQTFRKFHVESFNSLFACLGFDLLVFRVISPLVCA